MRLLGRGRVPKSVRKRVGTVVESHSVPPPLVIAAGNYQQAMDWCHAHGVNHYNVIIVTCDQDAHRLQGHRFTSEQVLYVGTWHENKTEVLRRVIKERTMVTDGGQVAKGRPATVSRLVALDDAGIEVARQDLRDKPIRLEAGDTFEVNWKFEVT